MQKVHEICGGLTPTDKEELDCHLRKVFWFLLLQSAQYAFGLTLNSYILK